MNIHPMEILKSVMLSLLSHPYIRIQKGLRNSYQPQSQPQPQPQPQLFYTNNQTILFNFLDK